MNIKIVEETTEILPEYEKVPIAFEVKSRFRVELIETGLGGIKLTEEPTAAYLKDYDSYEERPSTWAKRWNISNWGILSAYSDETRIGGATIAWNTPEIQMLENRSDLVCLWDLRVQPDFRGKGVGEMLFAKAVEWAKERSCRVLKVETQNINVPACRFYARQGCELGAMNRFAYDEALNETQLLWYRNM